MPLNQRENADSGRTCSFRLLFRDLAGCLDHFVHELSKFFEPGGGNDDGIATAADVFGDAQETPARVFFQREDEGFALDLDFLRFERVLLDGRFWRLAEPMSLTLIGPASVR